MSNYKTKYKPEYCQKLIEHFSRPPIGIVEKEVETTVFFKGKPTQVVKKIKSEQINTPPYFEEFARSINVPYLDLLDWCMNYPEWGESFRKAKALQKEFLINQSLLGRYNPTFAIFTAKNITDMRDVSNHELTGKDGGAIKISDAREKLISKLGAIITKQSKDKTSKGTN